MWRVPGNILCSLDPKVKVKDNKAGFFEIVPLTADLVFLYYDYFELHLDFEQKTV